MGLRDRIFTMPWSSIICRCDFDIFEYNGMMIHDMIIYMFIYVLFHIYQHKQYCVPYVLAHVVFIQLFFFFFLYQLYQGTAWKRLYIQPLGEDDPLGRFSNGLEPPPSKHICTTSHPRQTIADLQTFTLSIG